MSSMTTDQIELAIWKEIAGRYLSVSHDHWHIDRVLGFAHDLHRWYGGDKEVITAAVIMHDLGRSGPQRHGPESISASITQAKGILNAIGFPEDKADRVLMAIAEHDQPDVTPSCIEGRILKDADFLAGFGAWGVLRVAMWSGESNRDVTTLLRRLEERMPQRVASLEFPKSIQLAKEQMLFTRLFLEELRQPPTIASESLDGKYIILEGVSAAGKDTQAIRLREHLEREAYSVLVVHEPGSLYRHLRDAWQVSNERELDDPMIMRSLLIADRYQLIQETIYPALQRGDIVLSVRSFISTLVYQCETDQERASTAFAHRFVPQPDLVLLLDLSADLVWTRIKSRAKDRGLYERKALLDKHRQLYLKICRDLFDQQCRVIDAERSIDEVEADIWSRVQDAAQQWHKSVAT